MVRNLCRFSGDDLLKIRGGETHSPLLQQTEPPEDPEPPPLDPPLSQQEQPLI